MSEQFFERRNQFPKKWTTLPEIASATGTRTENALVPYSGRQNYDNEPPRAGNGETEDRIRALEDRLIGSEKSNRALLDEVVRLQGDFKGLNWRQEDSLTAERKTRMQLENSLRASNNLIAQMASRIKNMEDRIMEEHSTVSALVTHTKNMEQSVTTQGQELFSGKQHQSNRVQELRNELDEMLRAKDNVERVSFALVEEVRQLKAKLESQSSDMASLNADLKTRTRRLEDENRQGLDALRRQSETQVTADLTTTQLRQQVENRLAEVRDVIVELRTRQEQSNQDGHRLEQQMQMRLGDVMSAIQEQSRKSEESLHLLETVQREKDHTADIEKTKLQGKIMEIVEEVSKKILSKENKLREELQQRCSQLEVLMREEKETTHRFQRDIKNEMAEQLQVTKKFSSVEINATQELIKSEKKRQNEKMQKLMEAQTLLDKQQEELKKAQDKLLVAEIHSRKKHEKINNEKMEALEDKVRAATSMLQQGLCGVAMQIHDVTEKLQEEMKARAAEDSAKGARTFIDMDARIVAHANKISQLEEMFNSKLKAVADAQTENIQEKVDSIALWQEVTQRTLLEIQQEVQAAAEQFYSADERQKLMKAEVKQRVAAESEVRTRDVEELRTKLNDLTKRLNTVKNKPIGDMEDNDLENIQASIRKLAESIATVKSVLTMKILSEQKLHENHKTEMMDKLEALRIQLEPVLKKLEKKRNNKKDPDPNEDENETNGNNSNNNNANDEDDKKDDDDKEKEKSDDDPGGSGRS